MSGLYVELLVFTVARVRPLIGLKMDGILVLYTMSQSCESFGGNKCIFTLIARPLLLRSPQDLMFANLTGFGMEIETIYRKENMNSFIYNCDIANKKFFLTFGK